MIELNFNDSFGVVLSLRARLLSLLTITASVLSSLSVAIIRHVFYVACLPFIYNRYYDDIMLLLSGGEFLINIIFDDLKF